MGLTDTEARALLGGLICGVVVALILTALYLFAMTRSPRWAARATNTRLSAPILGIVFVNALMLIWTLAGLVLGALYPVIEDRRPGGGVLSENLLFTSVVLALASGFVGVAWIVRGRVGALGWITTGLAVIAFGWVLPLLAETR